MKVLLYFVTVIQGGWDDQPSYESVLNGIKARLNWDWFVLYHPFYKKHIVELATGITLLNMLVRPKEEYLSQTYLHFFIYDL